MSVTVRVTDEKCLSDWAELAEIHKILCAASDKMGYSAALSLQKTRGLSDVVAVYRRCQLAAV